MAIMSNCVKCVSLCTSGHFQVNNTHKNVLDSDWLRAVKFKCNTSAKTVTQVPKKNSSTSRKNLTPLEKESHSSAKQHTKKINTSGVGGGEEIKLQGQTKLTPVRITHRNSGKFWKIF